MSVNERKKINKVISRSARNDYRNFVEDVLEDIDREDQAGNTREVYRLAKQLKPKSGNSYIQPSIDEQGQQITNNEQQLSAWADFLEKKFASRDDEPSVELPEDNVEVPDIQLEEVTACIVKLVQQSSWTRQHPCRTIQGM